MAAYCSCTQAKQYSHFYCCPQQLSFIFQAMTMAILLITSLVIIIFILAIMCIRRNAQVYSLKQQVNFLEFTLEQLAEKEKASKQDLGKHGSGTGQPNKL
jgi:hypothetical protein